MALTVISFGTFTPSALDTEESLDASDVTNKSYVAEVDTAALVAGEYARIRLHTKTLSGGTFRVAWEDYVQGGHWQPIRQSWPIPANIEIKLTYEQNGGTLRAVPWKLLADLGA